MRLGFFKNDNDGKLRNGRIFNNWCCDCCYYSGIRRIKYFILKYEVRLAFFVLVLKVFLFIGLID